MALAGERYHGAEAEVGKVVPAPDLSSLAPDSNARGWEVPLHQAQRSIPMPGPLLQRTTAQEQLPPRGGAGLGGKS